MRNWFTFGGLDSRDFGIYISGQGTFNAPEKDYESITVPGRDGDLLGIEKRLTNVGLSYPAFIYADFARQIAAMKSAFLALDGYQPLIDSYHPDEIRMAVFRGDMKVSATQKNDAGQFTLDFECKPQRYLVPGQALVEVTSGATLSNPTNQTARPLIRVTGTGTVTVGSLVITIAAHSNAYIDIDSDIMDCYCGSTNCNSYVSFQGYKFPTLPAGDTGITFSGPTKVEIAPRWWRV